MKGSLWSWGYLIPADLTIGKISYILFRGFDPALGAKCFGIGDELLRVGHDVVAHHHDGVPGDGVATHHQLLLQLPAHTHTQSIANISI